MNASAFTKVDKATFFRFVERQADGRYEFVRGRIMQQQQGGTQSHGRITAAFLRQLANRLDPKRWIVLVDRGIETNEAIRYADVSVEPSTEPAASHATTRPAIIVEVLSPTSSDRDLDVKPSEYLAIPTLQAYIVASQDEVACFAWVRDDQGQFPKEPSVLTGAESVIGVPSLALSIALGAVYDGIIG
jgi:Uma2 family endonuclease